VQGALSGKRRGGTLRPQWLLHLRSAMTAAGRYVVPLIAVASIACGSSVDVIDPGPEPREETVIRIRADDPAVAEALGWQTGIPDAIVYLRRDADAQIRTLRTNEDGETTLGDLPSATYWTWGV